MPFSVPSFVPGQRMIDGQDLINFFNLFFSSATGIVALAGGGNTGTQLTKANNVVATVASGSDSVVLPPSTGLPIGAVITITNHGAQTLAVFGSIAPSTADTIASASATTGAASVTQLTGKVANYELVSGLVGTTAALWKQFLSA